jgi:hypothetical protein
MNKRQQPTVIETHKGLLVRLGKLVRTAVFWRLPGFAFWFWLVKIQGRPLQIPLLAYCWWLCLLPFLGQLFNRQFRVLVVFLPIYLPLYYFVVFPIATLVNVGSFLVLLYRLVSRLLHTTIRIAAWTASGFFLSIGVLIYAGLLSWLSLTQDSGTLCYLSWACLGSTILLAVSVGVRWALFPFSLPSTLIKASLLLVRLSASMSVRFEISCGTSRRELEEAGNWLNDTLLNSEHESGLSSSVRHMCVPLSLVTLAVLFLLLALGFGFSYFGLWKSYAAFSSSEAFSSPTLSLAVYHALTVAVTAPSSVLSPIAWPALLIQALQQACTLLVVALVPAALFFNLAAKREEYYADIRGNIEKTRDLLRKLWRESKKREDTIKAKRAKRDTPSSLNEALARLRSVVAEAKSNKQNSNGQLPHGESDP